MLKTEPAARLSCITSICATHYLLLDFLRRSLLLRLLVGADITYFMGNPEENRAACVTQGALQQFFQVCVSLCVGCMYVVLYYFVYVCVRVSPFEVF